MFMCLLRPIILILDFQTPKGMTVYFIHSLCIFCTHFMHFPTLNSHAFYSIGILIVSIV